MADYDSSLPVRTEADVDERLQSKIVDYTNPAQGMEVDADNDAHVKAKLRDDSGAAFGTAGNPIAVVMGADAAGDGVMDYATAAAVAKNASTTHTYAISALKTGRPLKVSVSGSGKFKAELKYGPASTTVSKGVKFNSTANPNCEFKFDAEILLAATDEVEVVITNRDNQAQDLYSTIEVLEF